ncbi:MAG: hypothetical protein H6710_06275 [Myxococcales bacterium]|nr:hypothetical protein [Myxococcales bacterium]MCB9704543.1 hypothetical protein [Myxococcales bacterium]
MSENRISLTDFVDFVTRAGMPKLTKVRQLKHRGEYHMYSDFYRGAREAIIAAHAEGRGRASIGPAALASVEHDRRRPHYHQVIDGYVGWWGRKALEWSPPPHALRRFDGFDLNINPELGLRIAGVPHVVKLYFKEPPLSKRYAEVVACVMHESLPASPPGAELAILDVRRRRLHCLRPRPELSALVAGELAALETMWSRI